jgi:hypothetical protein
MDYLEILKKRDLGKAEIPGLRGAVANLSCEKSELSEKSPVRMAAEPSKTAETPRTLANPPATDSTTATPVSACPYALPEGIKLLRYEPKAPPVAVTVCSVVNDVPKFIRHALGELDARLRHPLQIKAGDSVFDLLSKLADCGLELRLEWSPMRIIENPPDSEPSKPSKASATPELNPHGVDISDEDSPV